MNTEGIAKIAQMNNHAPAKHRSVEQQVEQTVLKRLEECPYSFIFCKVTPHFEGDCLTLRGSVPTFHLKQTLQELLRDIEHVKEIRNEVDVVSSSSLSSVLSNNPR